MAKNPFLWWLPAEEAAQDDTPAKAPARGKGRKAAPPPAAAADMSMPLQSEVQDKPGYLIRRAQQIAVAIFLEECGDFDLTPVQYAALLAVRDNPGVDATRIAGIVALDRTTISGVLERLESKGLIGRTSNEADRRAKLLQATAAGKKLLKSIGPHVASAQDRILGPLTEKERQQLMGLLGKLVHLNNDASRAPRRISAEA